MTNNPKQPIKIPMIKIPKIKIPQMDLDEFGRIRENLRRLRRLRGV